MVGNIVEELELSDLVRSLIPDLETTFSGKKKEKPKRLSKMQECFLNGGCPRKSRKNCNVCMSEFSGRMHDPDEFADLEDW